MALPNRNQLPLYENEGCRGRHGNELDCELPRTQESLAHIPKKRQATPINVE